MHERSGHGQQGALRPEVIPSPRVMSAQLCLLGLWGKLIRVAEATHRFPGTVAAAAAERPPAQLVGVRASLKSRQGLEQGPGLWLHGRGGTVRSLCGRAGDDTCQALVMSSRVETLGAQEALGGCLGALYSSGRMTPT
uniref:Uncharacterized protein n=1 Tax=Molossus molossus TaxID=27622 RepID=A0A7J8IZK8_MOLMO|nr:hypothetical protein HJG59_010388 [Molossus molossus]